MHEAMQSQSTMKQFGCSFLFCNHEVVLNVFHIFSNLIQRHAGEMRKNYITSSYMNKPEALLQPDEHLPLNRSAFCL